MNISKFLVAATFLLGGVLGTSSSIQAGYICKETWRGTECSGWINGQTVKSTTKETWRGLETNGTVGGKSFKVICRETWRGTECD